MAFKGITFAGQNVTPKNDGGLYQAHYGDGILWGCSMSLSGDDLVIQSGEFIMGGRVVQVDGATNVDLSGRTLQTGYIQVIMNADMTQSEGSQWYTSFVESATTTFPTLTTDDINDNGDLYQLQLAVVQISSGNLTGIFSSIRISTLESQNTLYITNDVSDPTIFLGNTTDRSSSAIQYASASQILRVSNYTSGTHHAGSEYYSDGSCVVFSNGSMYFRPNGRNSNAGAISINTNGHLTLRGSNPLVQNGTGGCGIRLYDSENPVIFADKTAIYFRPNGVNDGTGAVAVDTVGRIQAQGIYGSTTTGSANLIIGSSGIIQRTTSLRKFKKDIKPITEKDAEKGYELNPVSFVSNIEEDTQHEQYGFIAEEVADTLPNLATYSLEGELDGVAYDRVCAILLKQNQMLKARVDALEERVKALEEK